MADRKEIPAPTPDVVIPPNLDHTYFERGADHPFRPQSSQFELVNAWWLAESALLAYAAPDEAAPRFEAGGFRAEFFRGPAEGTQAYLLVRDDCSVVAFRGTQVPKPGPGASEREIRDSLRELIKDAMADERIALVPIAGGARVHRGFQRALDEIYPSLERRLDALRQGLPPRPLFFTGHSLGAALATLAAQRHGSAQALYTFGSPLVGDAAFASAFPIQSAFRIVHNNDVVTRVPPFGPWRRLTSVALDTRTSEASSTSTARAASTTIPRSSTASVTDWPDTSMRS